MKYSGEVRPWGSFINLADNVKCTTKVMTIMPDQSLSVQYHKKRDQLYYALEDGLSVEWGPQLFLNTSPKHKYKKEDLIDMWIECAIVEHTKMGQMFYFPRGCIHRCFNATEHPIQFLDIAFGENSEDDIIRIDDRYGR